jgi:hypothetical protein
VIDPNGEIKSNVFTVTQPANCSPALPPAPAVVNSQPPTKTETPPPTYPPIEEKGHVNETTGELEFEYDFQEPGEAEEVAEVVEGATLSRFGAAVLAPLGAERTAFVAKQKKCKKGFVKKGKKCLNNRPVLYGHASLTVPAAGIYKIHIKPGAKVLAALKKGKKLNVRVTLRFTPKGTAVHIIKVTGVKVHLKKTKKHHHK